MISLSKARYLAYSIRRYLAKADLSLTEAVDFALALKYSRPARGVISVAEVIEKAMARCERRCKNRINSPFENRIKLDWFWG